VRGAAVWALSRLAPARLKALSAQGRGRDHDPAVTKEWDAALA